MNWKIRVLMIVVVTPVLLPGSLRAQTSEPVLATEALSPSTRALLIQEMQALGTAMGRIHLALVTGEHQTVAAEAKTVHDSFVLDRELSESQRQEIGTRLPPAFLAADQDFHELSANLADAATRKDSRLERVWFDEMTRACIGCHQTFASKRFVGLMRSQERHLDTGTHTP